MLKFIVQNRTKREKKKTPGTATTKSSVCLLKVLELFLWLPFLILEVGILGIVGKCAAPLFRQLSVDTAGDFFFLLPMVLWGFCYKWEL
jgi:hypothetical protein